MTRAVLFRLIYRVVIVAAFFTASPALGSDWFLDLWFTPDQRGDRLMKNGEYARAAEVYTDPFRRGAALFRDGQFEKATAVFAQLNTAESHFNRGNALVMQGKYQEAIKAYGRALELHSDWPEAKGNMEIARLRAEKMEIPPDEGTGGMLGADDISIDTGAKKDTKQKESIDMGDGPPLSDEGLRELWLRRVQTGPADFLKSKFAYQYQHKKTEETE